MHLSKYNLACFFVKFTLGVEHKYHRANKKPWLLLEKLIRLNQKAMKLITIWLLNQKCLFKESLPLAWQLSFYEMGQYEVLLIFGTLYL